MSDSLRSTFLILVAVLGKSSLLGVIDGGCARRGAYATHCLSSGRLPCIQRLAVMVGVVGVGGGNGGVT
jgi:hypothetical protein